MRQFIVKHHKILFIAIAVICITYIAGAMYVHDYYHADAVAQDALNSDDAVTVTTEKKGKIVPVSESVIKRYSNPIVFAPSNPSKADKALIFYPGGKVEYTAYAPLLHELAQNNYVCILVHMPVNLAVLDSNAADGLINKYQTEYPSIRKWYIGGHSLGGAMAASYASKHSSDFDGLYLFAAYSTVDLTDSGLKVYSIYGSNDEVLNMNKYQKYQNNLPSDTNEFVIDGGCHSYFGSYGMQKGDGTPDISADEQIKATIDFLTYD
ncbi:alpha/beta hydrolase [Agathobacter sp.]